MGDGLPAAALAEQIALVGGTAIPATGEPPIRNAVVLVKDGVIKRIGPNIEVPSDYDIVDVKGKWLTPGLIDVNVHLTSESSPVARPLRWPQSSGTD